ncbi:MAG: DUF1156 domain-containing protein [Atribacterota bacterium]|jgi:adenine-specific DNA methylase|nr:DUF1156 domain-containing protein [Atribacterota bacterium]
MKVSAASKVVLKPFALQDAPALIEKVFPAQKVSFEAQKERKANLGQTLTGLGSYWKGRKPLILVRAIVLGSLLPVTENAEADLAMFEKLMAFDNEGLARRAFAANAFSATKIQELIPVTDSEYYFSANGSRWQRSVTDDEKLELYRQVLATFDTYEEKAGPGKRPEEVDQDWLLGPVWAEVNSYYAHLGVQAKSMPELIEQLGLLRYGHRPRVGDTFSGGGSIPFEAARMGCDVYASDLNPIACMLTWGALNIVGASEERRKEILQGQQVVAKTVNKEITALNIEHDEQGNRAKAYLYCLEARCPETGWLVPMAPSWVISKGRNIIARLKPNSEKKCFDIQVLTSVTAAEMKQAEQGTVQKGELVYELDGRTYRTPIRTLRGDYKKEDGSSGNRLRLWGKSDFRPRQDDIYQERLYAIHWIERESIDEARQMTFFAAPTENDLKREQLVESIVEQNLAEWQESGLVPDMPIESGYNTDQPIRERGWTHWHHLFNARQLLLISAYMRHKTPEDYIFNAKSLDWNSRLANWMNHWEKTNNVFYNQALNPFYNYGIRCYESHEAGRSFGFNTSTLPPVNTSIKCAPANAVEDNVELWVTDPPYADAVNYHEITEFFIAWLRKAPPKPFDEWVWDSKRALAVKGSGDDFRRGMVDAYKAMTEHMPDNGMQCVMFTHQNTNVWSDMVGIFWAAGLQVVAAWYIATETSTELKKGGYVQGTVTLMLKKRTEVERSGFRGQILNSVRAEVHRQIESMMHLNDEVTDKHGEPVFNDSDLQMAGYAAALKVLTAYTHIGGEDVTDFALRPRTKGEVTVVDEMVQQAAEAANNLLVPEGLGKETWTKLSGIERFVLRMLDMETTGASKLDNYQNFAKAFHVEDYNRVMASSAANSARLKSISEFESRDLSDSTELGASRLGQLFVQIQQLLADVEPKTVVSYLQETMPDFFEVRPLLVDLLSFIEVKVPDQKIRDKAEILAARLKNMRFGD